MYFTIPLCVPAKVPSNANLELVMCENKPILDLLCFDCGALFHLFCLPCCAKSTAEAQSWQVIVSTLQCVLRVELIHPPTHPTMWLRERRCVAEGRLPLNTGPTEGSNYLSSDWKCWKCWWWLAKITAWEKDVLFFSR